MLTDGMKQVIQQALHEDAPSGDVTSEKLIPERSTALGKLHAREAGIISGLEVLREVFLQIDSTVIVESHCQNGAHFAQGDLLATISGNARAVLRGERIALNFMQRMSGIATLTSEYVKRIEGTNAKILDTRKTTPGLREFERVAVRDGGGVNHRFSLSDAVLIKDNHLIVLAEAGKDLTDELIKLRARIPAGMTVEVEVDRLDQIPAVLAGGVDIIMLDNFALEELREGVALVGGQALTEASGGVTLETVREIALTGVDRISVGALTHSARAIDLALDVEIQIEPK